MRNRCTRWRRARVHSAWLLLLGVVGAHAASVYECRSARGEVAYQDHACAPSQRQSEVPLDPPPAVAPASAQDRVRRTADPRPARASHAHRRGGAVHEAMSWECRAADGAVFYRHGACPKSIRSRPGAGGGRRSGTGAAPIPVSATPLSRAEACRRLAHAGGRAGREHDESVSTYERNAGRDPCRRY